MKGTFKNVVTKATFWRNRLKKVKTYLRVLLYIAILSVGLIEFWLINIPEWFPKASVIGSIWSKLCFAYITSFIFFFINVHLQSYTNKVKSFRYINNKLSVISLQSQQLLTIIQHQSHTPNSSSLPSKDELEKWCTKISPSNKVTATSGRQFDNWFMYFHFIDMETKRLIGDLVLVKENLDSETLRLLTNIDDLLELHINFHKGASISISTLKNYSNDIHRYLTLCSELIDHLKKEFKFYQDEYHYLERKKQSNK